MDPPRRLSTSSSGEEEDSPTMSNFNSSTSLILVHESDEPSSPFDFPDDEDEVPESPDYEIRRSWSPAMSPSLVFLYLLSPYLKLGAMLLPNTQLPLKFGIPPLVIFAVLTAFARQIWYMLARYMRKADLEDIVLDAFARGRGKERRRAWLRALVRAGTGMLRVILAGIYLRESVHNILPLLPDDLPFPPQPALTFVFVLTLLPFASVETLTAKRVVYATGASILTYLTWFVCVAVSHANGTLQINPGWLRMGAFWQGITTTAFIFTSSSTLPLYASLKAGIPHSGLSKSLVSRSFRTLSSLSVAVAVGLTLPLVFFTSRMNAVILQEPFDLQAVIALANSLTLLLAIPSTLVTTPSLPVSERLQRSTMLPISKYLLFVLVISVSLVPERVARVFSDILLASACAATFFLPALIHITTHFFKKPLSIVIPQLPATPSAADELLQRKEDALQKRQWRRRVIWDIGVWTLLLPVGGGGFVWGAGRLAGKW
ncbi:hypothetical protein MIND_00846900 [Mycena indigotica]|uniref:Uncharacterized protein n=1 Tax=Mycena indigotica TaxID=2126181 RepID=A0A8H6SHI8_9AGAR|nr:uncharacterized protein MIND_00846900 [Mycena indigotica]KAF7298987.1 hypothetical protein MIND_00846900 [Mycena indigotica]